MNRGILSRIALDLVTLTSARNIQRVENTFDISDTREFQNRDIDLPANNSNFDDPNAQITLLNIQSFVHLQFSQIARLTLTNQSGSITIDVDRLFYAVSSFDSILINSLNTDQDKSLFVKAIYA